MKVYVVLERVAYEGDEVLWAGTSIKKAEKVYENHAVSNWSTIILQEWDNGRLREIKSN